MTTTPYNVENLTAKREEIVQKFFDAIRPLLAELNDLDAAERILRGTTQQIAKKAAATVSANGDVARKESSRGSQISPAQDGKAFDDWVREAIRAGAQTSQEAARKVQAAGYRFPKSKYTPGTVTSWTIQELIEEGEIRKVGKGLRRRVFMK